MSLLLALWLAAASSEPGADLAQVYRLTLTAARQDYFLPSPRRRRVLFKLDARRAPPKARLMFKTPLPAGDHQLLLEVAGATADRTLVIAVPLASGRSSITVTIDGPGRYDLGFWSGNLRAPSKEYRFTVDGPLAEQTFAVDLP